MAPSCALLFLPFGLPVSFRCYGRVYLIPRQTLSSGKAVRSKLDCLHEPPVQSDRCALTGNYHLESNPERHDKAPLAAAIGKSQCARDFREAAALLGVMHIMPEWSLGTMPFRLMRLLVVVVAGVVAYFATLLLLGFRVKEFARRTA